MFTLAGKIALVVVLSHGLRVVGRIAGPRWGALALGLPCTSAVALVGCGLEQGATVSHQMADQGLLGLTGAVALPIGFAEASRRGSRLGGCVLAAASAYFLSTWAARELSPLVVGGKLGMAVLAIVAGVAYAARNARPRAVDLDGAKPTSRRLVTLRTLIPVACLLAILVAGRFVGPIAAGLLTTFPGVGLSILILARLENGAGAAIRLAYSLPLGNFGMIAFLATFPPATATAGLGWGLAAGYAAALVSLGIVAVVGLRLERREAKPKPGSRPIEFIPAWPRPARTFLPRLEPIAA